jgi:LysM repeat protein
MKRIPLLIVLLALATALPAPGQDAATEERLNKLSGQIEDLFAAQRAQTKRIEALAQEIADLREDLAKPNPTYATQEDLKRLADAAQEIDQKRLEDYEKIRAQLQELVKLLANQSTAPETAATNAVATDTNSPIATPPENGQFEYVIQPNDSLSMIAQTFRREKNLKITVSDILKANPGLVPDRIRPGRKIVIPVPAQ